MLSTCQAMQLLTWRLTKLYEQGRATPGMAAMVKAHNSLRGREVGMGCWREGVGKGLRLTEHGSGGQPAGREVSVG